MHLCEVVGTCNVLGVLQQRSVVLCVMLPRYTKDYKLLNFPRVQQCPANFTAHCSKLEVADRSV